MNQDLTLNRRLCNLNIIILSLHLHLFFFSNLINFLFTECKALGVTVVDSDTSTCGLSSRDHDSVVEDLSSRHPEMAWILLG